MRSKDFLEFLKLGKKTPSEIADHFGVFKSQVTNKLYQLKCYEYIDIEPCQIDSRKKYLSITEKGLGYLAGLEQ